MNLRNSTLALLVALAVPNCALAQVKNPPSIAATAAPESLAGTWQFAFDRKDEGTAKGWATGEAFSDTINLPTTTDAAQKGPLLPFTGEAWKLSRRHPYLGVAWYRRTVSVSPHQSKVRLWLFLERTKATTVFVDGKSLPQQISIVGPQIFNLGHLSPGSHTLALRVDNRLERWPDRVSASHQLEESTQTNWNGVLGRIELRADGSSTLFGVSTAPGSDPSILVVTANLVNDKPVSEVYRPEGQMSVRAFDGSTLAASGIGVGTRLTLSFGAKAHLWDEFHPHLYRLEVTLKNRTGQSHWTGMVGLRSFKAHDASFEINGHRTFLRGKHDACVFPLTGYAPMTEPGWRHYFAVCKSYGLNHIRFHSWCPPEAAFAVADQMGFYLQPELPFWGDPSKPGVEPFLVAEGRRILRAYGNHPSFVMLSLGNEYWGDPLPRPRMVAELRSFDRSRLFDQGSNSESWNAHEFPGDDYRVSAYVATTDLGAARGSYAHSDKRVGYIISGTEGTMHTYSEALAGTKQPFISHEVGQYQTYPNFAEAAKYTGVLRADNFEVFKDRLTKTGMLDQADLFFQASGHLSALLYREEIEGALRTPEMDGFELLDLQDYPGQGTALVGMLDAFMDSKGLISASDWRRFCSPVVPLAFFPKFTWLRSERFHAQVRIANYGPTALNSPAGWSLALGQSVIAQGQLAPSEVIPRGQVSILGTLNADLSAVTSPAKLSLTVSIGTHSSSWPVWVYDGVPSDVPATVSVARKLDADTLAKLNRGERVVLMPKAEDLPGSIPGDFATDFWNYPMFKGGNPPGTLGYLIQNRHPALAEFPTESYSDWQWQTLAHHSRAVILDGFSGLKPIVQTIDNFERNHRLGTIFECRVGNGRLLVCTIDLASLPGSPEAIQLRKSLLDYAGSDRFNPAITIDGAALAKALHG